MAPFCYVINFVKLKFSVSQNCNQFYCSIIALLTYFTQFSHLSFSYIVSHYFTTFFFLVPILYHLSHWVFNFVWDIFHIAHLHFLKFTVFFTHTNELLYVAFTAHTQSKYLSSSNNQIFICKLLALCQLLNFPNSKWHLIQYHIRLYTAG